MTRLTKADLAQMNRDYFQSLELERLVEVTVNLHELAAEQCERLEQNSHNSSRPPSSDNPYTKKPGKKVILAPEPSADTDNPTPQELEVLSDESSLPSTAQNKLVGGNEGTDPQVKRTAGKQPGAPGKWRSAPLVSEATIPHFPETCAACNGELTHDADLKCYMGYHTLELEKESSGFRIKCNLHHYYENSC